MSKTILYSTSYRAEFYHIFFNKISRLALEIGVASSHLNGAFTFENNFSRQVLDENEYDAAGAI